MRAGDVRLQRPPLDGVFLLIEELPATPRSDVMEGAHTWRCLVLGTSPRVGVEPLRAGEVIFLPSWWLADHTKDAARL